MGLLFLFTLSIWTIFLYTPDRSYFYRMKSPGMILRELILALGKSFLSFTAVVFFLQISLPVVLVLSFFAADFLVLMIFRFTLMQALNYYRTRGRSYRNVIIVGTGQRAKEVADKIYENRNWGINILGFMDYHRTGMWRYHDIPLLGHPDGLSSIIADNQVDYLIIAVDGDDMPLTQHAFAIGEEMGVTVCFMPDFYYHRIASPLPGEFMGFPAVVYSCVARDRWHMLGKKCLDYLGALVGIMLAIPVGLLTAIAIKLEDGGPIFFRQTRSGINGKPFKLYKFRTMVADAEKLKDKLLKKNEMSGPVFKIKSDPRITRVGSLLRKTSLDELPQFINILRGEMSLVGPRPPLPSEVVKYDRWQRRKLSVKPGLTCLWQINGRNQIDFEDWMKLDLEYIDNWSLWLDTKILVKTLPAVLKGDGAS